MAKCIYTQTININHSTVLNKSGHVLKNVVATKELLNYNLWTSLRSIINQLVNSSYVIHQSEHQVCIAVIMATLVFCGNAV